VCGTLLAPPPPPPPPAPPSPAREDIGKSYEGQRTSVLDPVCHPVRQ
jgi:hypothetical protein